MVHMRECVLYCVVECRAWTDMETVYLEWDDGTRISVCEVVKRGWNVPKLEAGCGMLPFSVGGKFGFVDVNTGRVVVRPEWDFVYPFEEKSGLAQVFVVCSNCQSENPFCFHLPNFGYAGKIDANGKLQAKLRWFDLNGGESWIIKEK